LVVKKLAAKFLYQFIMTIMSRPARHLALLSLLRDHTEPVTGQALADALDISLRTLYRDIAILQSQGAVIEGEPGIGYILRPGYLLPAMIVTKDEIEAFMLGGLWVADRAEVRLGQAAQTLMHKMANALPDDLKGDLNTFGMTAPPHAPMPETHIDTGLIRMAIRREVCVYMSYIDLKGMVSERTVWPMALAFFDHLRTLVVWCELRQAFRHFRTERILSWTPLDMAYPKRRQALLGAWRDAIKGAATSTPEQKNKNMMTGFGSMSDEA
jgi:predicted DNA-binding transcriptional regulator YafY